MNTLTKQSKLIESQNDEIFILRMVFYLTIGTGGIFDQATFIKLAFSLLIGYSFYRYAMWRKRQKDENTPD